MPIIQNQYYKVYQIYETVDVNNNKFTLRCFNCNHTIDLDLDLYADFGNGVRCANCNYHFEIKDEE